MGSLHIRQLTSGRLGAILFIAGVFLLSLKTVIDPDFGWQLGVGRYIWEQRSVPRTDLFSFSLPDYPYVYYSWLTDALLFGFWRVAGFWGASFFYALVSVLSFWILLRRTRLRSASPRMPLYLLFLVPLVLWIVGQRRQVVTFMLLNLLVYLFERSRIQERRWLLILPIIFLLWANLHGGFLLGLGVLFLLSILRIHDIRRSRLPVVEQRAVIRVLVVSLVLAAAAALATPYGSGTYRQTLTIASNRFNWEHNLDWKPLILAKTHFAVFAGMVYVAVVALLTSTAVARREKIFLGLFFFLSLVTRRYVSPLFVFLLPPLLTQGERFWLALRPRSFAFPLRVASAAVVVAYSGVIVRDLWKLSEAHRSPSFYATEVSRELHFPFGAAQFMRQRGLPRRLLNDFSWGGYLQLQFPGRRFFIDGRMENFFVGGQPFAQEYRTIIKLEPGWEERFSRYDFDGVLAPVEEGKTWPLVELLLRDANWRVVYEDEVAILFVASGG